MTRIDRIEPSELPAVPVLPESFAHIFRELSSDPGPDMNVRTTSRNDSSQSAVTFLPPLQIVDGGIAVASDVRQGARTGEQPAVLSGPELNNLIRGPHGLGSENFAERERAQRQLERSGTAALPAVLGALQDRSSDLPLETRRRLESFTAYLRRDDGFNDLIAATRNNDFGIASAAQAMLGRESTDTLLLRPTHTALSPENQNTFNELIRTRLNDGQLQALTQQPPFGWTEGQLRRAVAAEQVLGVPSGSDNQGRLGVLLFNKPNRTDAERSYAESLLTTYAPNGSDPVLRASANRLLASSAFERGNTDEGMRLMRNSLGLITGATGQIKNSDVLLELEDLSLLARNTLGNARLSTAQRNELTGLSQSATQAALVFVRARQEWMDQNKQMSP